jgi:hypothetical protein
VGGAQVNATLERQNGRDQLSAELGLDIKSQPAGEFAHQFTAEGMIVNLD